MKFLHSPLISSLLKSNFLNTLFSNTISLRSSLNVNDQVSHPYKTTGKIVRYVIHAELTIKVYVKYLSVLLLFLHE
jgi:hypothetical protein